MGKKIYISELEKACICYMYFTGQKIKNAYELAKGKKGSQPVVSVWLNSEPVQAYLLELKQRDLSRMSIYQSGENETGGKKSGGGERNEIQLSQIDFTDITQFIRYLNNQANTITDESHRQKYLSMLSDLLRFKESGTDKNTDIQRFYIPLTCKDCQLYKDSKSK